MELISVKDVAKELGCSYEIVREGIKNGTLPIGFVSKLKSRSRIIIPRDRWEAWKKGII